MYKSQDLNTMNGGEISILKRSVYHRRPVLRPILTEHNGERYLTEFRERIERRYVRIFDEDLGKVRIFEVTDYIPSKRIQLLPGSHRNPPATKPVPLSARVLPKYRKQRNVPMLNNDQIGSHPLQPMESNEYQTMTTSLFPTKLQSIDSRKSSSGTSSIESVKYSERSSQSIVETESQSLDYGPTATRNSDRSAHNLLAKSRISNTGFYNNRSKSNPYADPIPKTNDFVSTTLLDYTPIKVSRRAK